MNIRSSLEVLFTPAEFNALEKRDLRETTCVVFDILRATSSMVTALAHGAEAIFPCREISEAIAVKSSQQGILLAGERDGLRITSQLTGSIDFDFGNSPREFTREKVRGHTIAITTTNGTRALRACARARSVFVAAFLNLRSLAEILKLERPQQLLLVCSGTREQAAYEDILGAGALCELLSDIFLPDNLTDSALTAAQIYRTARPNLLASLKMSQNGKRLLNLPDLQEDIEFCAQRDIFDLVAKVGKDGHVRATMPGPQH